MESLEREILTKGIRGYIVCLVVKAKEVNDVRPVGCTDVRSARSPRKSYHCYDKHYINKKSAYGKTRSVASWRPPQGRTDVVLGTSCRLV